MADGANPPPEVLLSKTFGFSAGELAVNRQGHVADGQLAPEWRAVLWGSLIVVGAAFGVAVMMRTTRGPRRIVTPLAASVAALLITVIVILPAVRDLAGGAVRWVDGAVTDMRSVGKGRGKATVVVAGKRLLSQADFDAARSAVNPRTRYRFYYLPHQERLLSLEPLPP